MYLTLKHNGITIILVIFLCSIMGTTIAQEFMVGKPFITNYTKNEIGISSINHDIIQDSRGVIYMANDFGILEFDGQNWTIVQNATNGSNIISLAVDKNNRIYAGAQGDFGYLDYHNEYKLIFKSLIDKIPKQYRNFGDVWQTHVSSNGVVFHSWDATYIYTGDTVRVIKFDALTKESFQVRDTVYIQSRDGLYFIDNLNVTKVAFSDFFTGKDISFMLPYGHFGFLVGTTSHGIYTVDKNEIIPFPIRGVENLQNFQLADGILLKNGNYILVTIQNGIFFIDSKGNLQNYLSKYNGLQSNLINCLLSDKLGNLWIGTNGVDYLETSSPLSMLSINQSEPHASYSTVLFDNNLYVATHHGLFCANWDAVTKNRTKSTSFIKIDGLPDIIWNLQLIDGALFISTQDGFYQLINNKAVIIAKTEGAWLLKKVKEDPNLLLGGTYTGLVWLKKVNGYFQLYKKIGGYYESSRILEQDDNGNIWISHGYKGTYKLSMNHELDSVVNISFYDQKKGFPSNIYTGVYKINDELVFSSQYGFYSYDLPKDTMLIHNVYGERIGTSQHVRLLKENGKKIWFIYGESTGYIENFADGTYSVVTAPFNKVAEYYIPGFENIWFMSDNNAIIGTKTDLIFYNSKIESNSGKPFNSLLRRVESPINNEIIYDDRYQFLCDTLINENPNIEYIHNNLIFHFSASFYENIKDINFSYYLEGFDKKWSDWGKTNHKEYTNLPEGDYIFRLKAKNIYNTVSNESSYTFTVLPPWYRKTWAYALYFLFFIGFIVLLFWIRNRQVQKEKHLFMSDQQEKRAFQDAKYNEEKLKDELKNTNNELSSLASNVIYKNERISEIKLKLAEITPLTTETVKIKLTKVLDFIDKELEDDNWENFEHRFNQAHNDFIKRFKVAYPELTPKDLKLGYLFCAKIHSQVGNKL